MAVVVYRKLKQFIVLLLLLALGMTLVVQLSYASSVSSRYDNMLGSSGSPLLNDNWQSDAWNKWETVAFGVFLSNFVVPMYDTYESAFSTASLEGSKGAGYKALTFSTGNDVRNNQVIKTFVEHAIDTSYQLKEVYVSYHYVDIYGDVKIKDGASYRDAGPTESPLNSNYNPESAGVTMGSASFRDLLIVNLEDAKGVNQDIVDAVANNDNRGGGFWQGFNLSKGDVKETVYNTSYKEVVVRHAFYRLDGTMNSQDDNYRMGIMLPPLYDSTSKVWAKLPVLWIKGADGSWVKVWDMLDPWDFQLTVAMLGKELNDYEDDNGRLNTIKTNINTAYKAGSTLSMDDFGNIVCNLEGKLLMAIPAAYNKHITTEPLVNLVNSLFLTGATAGATRDLFTMYGKTVSTKGVDFFFTDRAYALEPERPAGNVPLGVPAFSDMSGGLPLNSMALYIDSATLATRMILDARKAGIMTTPAPPGVVVIPNIEAVTYKGVEMPDYMAALFGVLDIDLLRVTGNETGNREFNVRRDDGGVNLFVTPKLEIAGMSTASYLGRTDGKGSDSVDLKDADGELGMRALYALIAQYSAITNVLPQQPMERVTEYSETMYHNEALIPIFNESAVVPVHMSVGRNEALEYTWAGIARDFINYYGTVYYKQNASAERWRWAEHEFSSDTNGFHKVIQLRGFGNDKRLLSAPIVGHAGYASRVNRFYDVGEVLTNKAVTSLFNFVWYDMGWNRTYVQQDMQGFDKSGWYLKYADASHYYSLVMRWVKVYPVNPVLTEVASYLGMRGETEFAAACAPWVYYSVLRIYGVDNVRSQDINDNPTKFNENIYNAESAAFTLDPTQLSPVTDEDMARQIREYTYRLLTPDSSGDVYKRELMSNIMGNFIYDQYTRAVYGGSSDYRGGGVQVTMTGSQTGFLRFPSLAENWLTSGFYNNYAVVALWLLTIGLLFILLLGVLSKRKITWFLIAVVMLVTCVVVIPFINDIASGAMDALVGNILKDKTTIWSISEFLSAERRVADFASTGLSPEEAELAKTLATSMSIIHQDRSLMLRQDISRKTVTVGNMDDVIGMASLRWLWPVIMRQFSADDGGTDYLFNPLIDKAIQASDAYWFFNLSDSIASGNKLSDVMGHKYAPDVSYADMDDPNDPEGKRKVTALMGTRAGYSADTLTGFYADYSGYEGRKGSINIAASQAHLSYRSVAWSYPARIAEPIHNHVYMLMYDDATQSTAGFENFELDRISNEAFAPVIAAGERVNYTEGMTHATYWGDKTKLDATGVDFGGKGTFISQNYGKNNVRTVKNSNYSALHDLMVLKAQQYSIGNGGSTRAAEFGYLWSTETMYPYFYALVKESLRAAAYYDMQQGRPTTERSGNAWNQKSGRMQNMLASIAGTFYESENGFFGKSRVSFMHQGGLTPEEYKANFNYRLMPSLGDNAAAYVQVNDLSGQGYIHTGYVRDVLDLQSVFENFVPYMYQMTVVTGGLTGDHEKDLGLFGDKVFTDKDYKFYEDLPQSWLYQSNWVVKLVEAPAYNSPETIRWFDGGNIRSATISMTYLPDAYLGAACTAGHSATHHNSTCGRDMVFSEAQMHMMGLSEGDLSTFELKCIRLNKDVADRWTSLLNFIDARGLTSEAMVRQMALDALLAFNEHMTPSMIGNANYALYPQVVDLRNLSFDAIMKVIILNDTKSSNYLYTDSMESVIIEYGAFSSWLLLFATWICIYVVTFVRTLFLAALFFAGVYGVARSVFAANNSKQAVLFGYITNIVLLFLMSLIYYFIFNMLMSGANSAAIVGTGWQGAAIPPTIAFIIIIVASLGYIAGMIFMLYVMVDSLRRGTGDLGFGRYKDMAQTQIAKISKGVKDMRTQLSFERMKEGGSGGSSGGSSYNTGVGSTASHKGTTTSSRKSSSSKKDSDSKPKKSGSSAISSQGVSKKQDGGSKALNDYRSLDAAVERGNKAGTPGAPAMSLDNYLPSKTAADAGKGTSSATKDPNKK